MKKQISHEHITNNKAVGKALINRGIRPEELPPEEDIKKVERKLDKEKRDSQYNPDKLSE